MISPLLLKLAAWRKWIFIAAVGWTLVLLLVARSTAMLNRHEQRSARFPSETTSNPVQTQIVILRQENDRLRKGLAALPELRARSEQLRQEIATQEKKDQELWAGQSNALTSAIERELHELRELNRWSRDWHAAKQREAAQARLAEKAQEASNPGESGYAAMQDALSQFALAQNRITRIRHEWAQLDKTEKDKFRPRLQEAQNEWNEAYGKLGKDGVLFQSFPITNATQNPTTVLIMRSVVPDASGALVSVFLDGTVTFSKAGRE